MWSKGYKSSPNFLPANDPAGKKWITEIAIGSSLASHYYESIHQSQNLPVEVDDPILDGFLEDNADEIEIKDEQGLDNNQREEKKMEKTDVLKKFESFYKTVVEELHNDDKEFQKSILKFISRYEKFSHNQRKSALQSFGTVFVGKTRGKIKVQPTAVSRRKSKNGSRQKQDNAGTKSLPSRRVTVKRKHSLSQVINENVPSAKKAGRSMISNTKYPKRKK